MKRSFNILLVFVVFGLLSSCAGMNEEESEQKASKVTYEPILIRVSGYGTYEKEKDRLSERKRLMATTV